MKGVTFGIAVAVLATGSAMADCDYQGRTYSQGSTVCAAGGWLQECTPAGYWKAIGHCRAADAEDPAKYTVLTEPEPGMTPLPETEAEKTE